MFKVFRLTWYAGIFLIGDESSQEGKRFGAGEVEIMQSTGLADKNGQEIYEGDVVKLWIFPNDEKVKEVDEVIYSTNTALFATKRGSRILGLIEPHRELEVIGNVWENPELVRK